MRLVNISKSYGDVMVLDKISLLFERNGLVTILGPSGSGKSTLLKIAGSIDPNYDGSVSFGGNTVNKSELHMQKTRAEIIGFVFQEFNLIDSMTVRENIRISVKLAGMLNDDEAYRNTMSRFGLLDLENRMPSTLSGGEKQRAAIVRALLWENKVILADEPTGNLDEENADNVFVALREAALDHLVIVATHNEELALKYSDRIIRLKGNKIHSDLDVGYSSGPVADHSYRSRNIKQHPGPLWYLKFTAGNFHLRKKKMISAIAAMILALLSTALALGFYSGARGLFGDINLAILDSDKMIASNYYDRLFRTMDAQLIENISEALETMKVIPWYDMKIKLSNGDKTVETPIAVTDRSKFMQSRTNIIKGSYISEKNEVLLEESTAGQLFGDLDCISHEITIKTDTGSERICKISGIYKANNEVNVSKTIITTELDAQFSANAVGKESIYFVYPQDQTDNGILCKVQVGTGVTCKVNASAFREMLRLVAPELTSPAPADIISGNISGKVWDAVIGNEFVLQKLDLTAFDDRLKVEGIYYEEKPSESAVIFVGEQTAKNMNNPQINKLDIYLKDYSAAGRAEASDRLKALGVFHEMASDRIGAQLAVKVSVIGIMMAMISGVILLVTFLMCHFAAKMNILDRAYDVEVLKSLGASKSVISKIFISDNLLMGAFVSLIVCFLIVAANLSGLTCLLSVDGAVIYQFRVWHLMPVIMIGGILPLF